MQKLKNLMKHFFKENGLTYRFTSKLYHLASTQKYILFHKKEIKQKNKYYSGVVENAVECINGFKGKEYIVFYNPTWLGVAASTKGLFENNVPLEQVFGRKNIMKIANAVVSSNIKTIIFSQIVDGWTQVIAEIKRMKEDANIKVIWHGNCYEFFSDYTWNLNKDVMELCNEGKVDCIGFVRSTMYEFYKSAGFKACYLQNNVKKEKKEVKDNKDTKIKIGVYNADSRELKNIYTSLSAIKLVKNSIADVVPINEGAKKFTEILGLEVSSTDDYISNENLMQRIQKNEINIYPTFTENAPMFPLESFEMGVPCLLGNNNDYFVGTELGKFVILEREDDPLYIKEKIQEAIKNKKHIMELYYEWKIDFDRKCERYVKEFIDM